MAESVFISFSLPPELKKDILEYCEKKDLNFSATCRRFWKEYLEKQSSSY